MSSTPWISATKACVAFAMALGLAATAADPPGPAAPVPAPAAERVLVIDQEGQTRPAFVQFMDGFRAGLAEGRVRCDVFIENLDLARLNRTPDDPERAAGWLVAKYSDWSFDVIVPTSEVTRDFVLANRERLSPNARIVALERPGDRPAPLEHAASYTAATTDSTMGATVELACQLLPRLRRIALVSQSALRDARGRRPHRLRLLRAPAAQGRQLGRAGPRPEVHAAGSQWRRRTLAV